MERQKKKSRTRIALSKKKKSVFFVEENEVGVLKVTTVHASSETIRDACTALL